MTIVIAAVLVLRERGCMNAQPKAADQSENQHEESTYALLIRSEEQKRNVLELTIHPALMLSAVFAICQFAQQAMNLGVMAMSR